MIYDDDSGYALNDPKHPTYADRMTDVWDNREKVPYTPTKHPAHTLEREQEVRETHDG